jgi:hypothetical protein
MKIPELNLPLNFARYVLTEGYENELRVFMALKGMYDRKVVRSQIDYESVSSLTGLSESTIRRAIDNIVKMEWAVQQKVNLYFKSFGTICRNKGIALGRIHRVNIKQDLPTLTELLFTLALVWLIRFRAYVRRNKSRSYNGVPKHNPLQQFKSTTLSVRYLGRLLGLSPSKVHRLKHRAKSLGFIGIQANYAWIEGITEQWLCYEIPEMAKMAMKRLILRVTDDIHANIDTKSCFFHK